MKIYLVTRNKGKLLAAQNAFSDSDIELLTVEKDYQEIQADTSLEIARYTSLEAAKELGAPAIREDHSVFLNGLKQIPGPYMNYFNKKWSEKDIIELYKHIDDRTGYFEVATVLAFPDGKTIESVFRVNFIFSPEPRGTLQTGWATIMILEGQTKTNAEFPETERLHIWNQGYLEIKKKFKEFTT